MIAIIDHPIFNTSFPSFDLDDLLCDYDYEDLSDPPKLAFIKYWKRIIKVIHHYKNKCQTSVMYLSGQ